MQHSDLYDFASSYWWLMFPLGWGFLAVLRVWTRHRQAQMVLDLLKSYIDKGKEPPDALLEAVLPQAAGPKAGYQPLHLWLCAMLLGGGAIGFAALTVLRAQQGDADSANALFLAILVGVGAAACAAFAMILQARKPGPGAP